MGFALGVPIFIDCSPVLDIISQAIHFLCHPVLPLDLQAFSYYIFKVDDP
jgi:hypothetical protein